MNLIYGIPFSIPICLASRADLMRDKAQGYERIIALGTLPVAPSMHLFQRFPRLAASVARPGPTTVPYTGRYIHGWFVRKRIARVIDVSNFDRL